MPRSGATAAHALKDGTTRVMAAPAVLAGAVALSLALSAPPASALLGPSASGANSFIELARAMGMIGFSAYAILGLLVLWPFLSGGILDRYARNRPTRGRGFFGACGAHFGAMVRLAILAWMIYGALVAGLGRAIGGTTYGRWAAVFLTSAAGFVIGYARIRLVVEDRRSAIGALLAGARFARRNFVSAAALYLLYVILFAGVDALCRDFEPQQLCDAVRCLLVLSLYACQTALFQSRLAHASYTAAPPIEWPESPAAESIANAAPVTPS
jgi:hypothetical protein